MIKIKKIFFQKTIDKRLFPCYNKTIKRDTEEQKMITYKVTWKEMWTPDEMTFTDMEEAKKWAVMKRAMNYKEVKLLKVETNEIEF